MRTIFLGMCILSCLTVAKATGNLSASFKADKESGTLPLSVSFRSLNDQAGHSYKWDFGNGNSSMLKSPTATFVNPGKYTVKLVVSNGVQTDSSFMSIDVQPNDNFINMYKTKPVHFD